MKNCPIERNTISSKGFYNYSKYKNWIKYYYRLKLNIIVFLFFSCFLNIYVQTQYSNITLRVNKTGNVKILGIKSVSTDKLPPMPESIYINGKKQTGEVNTNYILNKTDNYITLIWNSVLDSTKNLFYECSDIIEIDLSNLITSSVTDMRYMFYKCSNLMSLDLSNFNTSSIKHMDNIFNKCSSLNNIILPYSNIAGLTSMSSMFRECSFLISLDLSSFNTSSVNNMVMLFYGCKKLISINLLKMSNQWKICLMNVHL